MQLSLFSNTLNSIPKENLLIDLFQAYYDTRRNKRNTINALKFEIEYEANLFQLYQEIQDRTYQPDRSICFINFKPIQREIFAADFRDRIVHHLIFNYLNPIVEPSFIKDSYSCRVGKGTHYGISRVQSFIRGSTLNYTRDTWILKLDILGYFMQINRQLVFDKIKKKLLHFQKPINFSKEMLLFLLEKIIFNDPTKDCIIKGKRSDWKGLPKTKSLFYAEKGKGFPIGNLTSQFCGNIYMNEFDHFVKEALGIKYYGRYVDDFVLIHHDKNHLKSLLPKIQEFLLEKLELQVHPRKIYFQHYSKGLPFLGTYIKPHRTYIGNRIKNNFYQTIKEWNKLIHEQGQKITIPQKVKFIASINSYLGMMQHYDTYRLRKKMLFRLHPAFFNYVYISGGYRKLVSKIKRIKKSYDSIF